MLIINIVGLLLTPFILKYLTKEEFALFYIAGDILMWLGLSQLGVSASFNSRAAQLFGQNKKDELKYLTSSAWGLQIASSIIIVFGGVGLSFFVNSFFNVPDFTHQTQIFFLILVTASAAQVMSQVFSSLLVSAKLINIDNRIKIVSIIPKIIFTVLFLFIGWKLIGLALANLIAGITPIIISIYYVRRKFPQIPINLKYWTKKHAGELLMNGIWFTLGGVAGILIAGLDRIVISKVVSLEIVASFIITQKLYLLTDKVLSQVFNVARPYMGQLYGAGDQDRLYTLHKFFIRLSVGIGVIAASAVFIINDFFIELWVGRNFYLGDEISLCIALNFIVQFVVLPNRVILATTMFRLNWQAYTRIIEGIFNLGLSIILGKHYGVIGVVIGSIVPSFFCSNIAYNWLSREFFRIKRVRIDSSLYMNYSLIIALFVVFLFSQKLPNKYSIFVSIIFLFILTYFWLRRFSMKSLKDGIFDMVPIPKIMLKLFCR